MKLLVVVLNEREHLEDVLEALLEFDVQGVTSIETEEVIHLLAQEVPIFAGLRHMLTGPREHNMTIFGVTERDGILDEIKDSLKEVGVDMGAGGFGYAFTVPIDGVIGAWREE